VGEHNHNHRHSFGKTAVTSFFFLLGMVVQYPLLHQKAEIFGGEIVPWMKMLSGWVLGFGVLGFALLCFLAMLSFL